MVFDLRDPRHPQLATSIGDLDDYMRPHSYLRLANGRALAPFQYHGGHGPTSDGGGLVEFDDQASWCAAESAMDAAAKNELIRPYSLVAMPALDRVVSTQHFNALRGGGANSHGAGVTSFGPEAAADDRAAVGSTGHLHAGCTTWTASRRARSVQTLDGQMCAVPLRIGRYWVQTLFSEHAVAAYGISDPVHMREVSRLTLDEKQEPPWFSAEADGRRIFLNSGEYGEHRMFMVNFDPATGALDRRLRDAGSDRPGVTMDGKSWPHRFQGNAYPPGQCFRVRALVRLRRRRHPDRKAFRAKRGEGRARRVRLGILPLCRTSAVVSSS